MKSATATQDVKLTSITNEYKEEDRGDDSSYKEDDQYLKTSVKGSPALKPAAAFTQNSKRYGISSEYEKVVGDDSSKEDHQHFETPTKSDADSSLLQITPQTSITSQATRSKLVLMDNLSFSIEEEDVKKFFKDVGEVAQVQFDMKDDCFAGRGHIEFTTAEAAQEALKLNNELLLNHPVRLDLAIERAELTPLSSGSKTLYLGNLSFAIEEDDVRDFFKDVGEIADLRFAIRDDRFLGYAHVEFTTAEAAQESLKLNHKVIVDRPVKLELARQQGAYTRGSSSIGNFNQRGGGQGQAKTIYVRGFDSRDGFDRIRGALIEHFRKCGEISRMSIPKDYESGTPKGVAFIDFEGNGFSEALRLNGSEIGGSKLTVEVAKKRTREDEGSSRGDGWVTETGYYAVRGYHRESASGRESGCYSNEWQRGGTGYGSSSSWHTERGYRSRWSTSGRASVHDESSRCSRGRFGVGWGRASESSGSVFSSSCLWSTSGSASGHVGNSMCSRGGSVAGRGRARESSGSVYSSSSRGGRFCRSSYSNSRGHNG